MRSLSDDSALSENFSSWNICVVSVPNRSVISFPSQIDVREYNQMYGLENFPMRRVRSAASFPIRWATADAVG